MAKYDAQGREIPDQTPVEIPPHLARVVTRHEQMKAYIRAELSRLAAEEGEETFEEADDFDVDEDPDPLSAYEIPDAPVEWPGGVKDEDSDPPPSVVGKNATGALSASPKGIPDPDSPSLDLGRSTNGDGNSPAPSSATGKPSDRRGDRRT